MSIFKRKPQPKTYRRRVGDPFGEALYEKIDDSLRNTEVPLTVGRNNYELAVANLVKIRELLSLILHGDHDGLWLVIAHSHRWVETVRIAEEQNADVLLNQQGLALDADLEKYQAALDAAKAAA